MENAFSTPRTLFQPVTERRHLEHVLTLHGVETRDGDVVEMDETSGIESRNVDPDVWTITGEILDPSVLQRAKEEEELRRFEVMRGITTPTEK